MYMCDVRSMLYVYIHAPGDVYQKELVYTLSKYKAEYYLSFICIDKLRCRCNIPKSSNMSDYDTEQYSC